DPRIDAPLVDVIALPHVEVDEPLYLLGGGERHQLGSVGEADLLDGVVELLHRQRGHHLRGVGLADDGVGFAAAARTRQRRSPAAQRDDLFAHAMALLVSVDREWAYFCPDTTSPFSARSGSFCPISRCGWWG